MEFTNYSSESEISGELLILHEHIRRAHDGFAHCQFFQEVVMEPTKEPTKIDVLKSAIGKAVNLFRSELTEVRARLESARRRREDLLTSPLSRDDVIMLLSAFVDRQADKFPPALAQAIRPLHGERSLKNGESDAGRSGEFITGVFLGPSGNGPSLPNSLMFLLRGEVKKGIALAIEQIEEWPENVGPPIEARKTELVTLEAEIKSLEGRLREFREEQGKISASFD